MSGVSEEMLLSSAFTHSRQLHGSLFSVGFYLFNFHAKNVFLFKTNVFKIRIFFFSSDTRLEKNELLLMNRRPMFSSDGKSRTIMLDQHHRDYSGLGQDTKWHSINNQHCLEWERSVIVYHLLHSYTLYKLVRYTGKL